MNFCRRLNGWPKSLGCRLSTLRGVRKRFSKARTRGGTSGTWQEGDEWDEMDVLVGESQLAVWEGRKALTRTEAFMVFLKEAGMWKDRGRFKPNRGNIEHPTSNAEHPMNAAPSPPAEDGQPEQVVAPGTPGNVTATGDGDGASPPLGVCAIPGTTFAKNFELREELHAWLYAVKCHQVVVALDDQDKSDRPMRDRHEALIWSQYLANDLMNKLPLQAKVCAAEGLAR